MNRRLTSCPICRSNRIRIIATWNFVNPVEDEYEDNDPRDQEGYVSETSANNVQHFDISNDGIPSQGPGAVLCSLDGMRSEQLRLLAKYDISLGALEHGPLERVP